MHEVQPRLSGYCSCACSLYHIHANTTTVQTLTNMQTLILIETISNTQTLTYIHIQEQTQQ